MIKKYGHSIYIGTLVLIELLVFIWLVRRGAHYYGLPFEERPFNEAHQQLKPSGILGHGFGIVGTLMMIIGVFGYMARKRFKSWYRLGRLKYWLEFHIFLCTLGPMLVLFHTAFKFGGIVSISFWSMAAVVLSGVFGRYVYTRIPHTPEGKALSLEEIQSKITTLRKAISEQFNLSQEQLVLIFKTLDNSKREKRALKQVRQIVGHDVDMNQQQSLLKYISEEIGLKSRTKNLNKMKKLFEYWHVIHLPFALIMLIIMLIHVGATLAFGYRWIL